MQGRVSVASVGQQPYTLAPAAKPRHAAYPAQRVRFNLSACQRRVLVQ